MQLFKYTSRNYYELIIKRTLKKKKRLIIGHHNLIATNFFNLNHNVQNLSHKIFIALSLINYFAIIDNSKRKKK